jgi:hypothetical protein
MMYWLSSAWLVLLVVSLTGRDVYTVLTHEPTLSADAEAGAKWPPLFVLYGAL